MGETNFSGPVKVAGVEVIDENGNIVVDIKDTLSEGSIYIGNSSNKTSELAIGSANYVLTSNGTTASWQPATIPSGTEIVSTAAGSTGVTLDFFHDSASPAQFDEITILSFYGNNDAGAKKQYVAIEGVIADPTDGSEMGVFGVRAMVGGSLPSGQDGQFFITGTGIEMNVPVLELQDEQELSGPGAIDVTSQHTLWTTTGADAGTLADATDDGFIKTITMVVDGGDGTLTPTNLVGYTTITFNDVGDTVRLKFSSTAGGWIILSNQGCTLA